MRQREEDGERDRVRHALCKRERKRDRERQRKTEIVKHREKQRQAKKAEIEREISVADDDFLQKAKLLPL